MRARAHALALLLLAATLLQAAPEASARGQGGRALPAPARTPTARAVRAKDPRIDRYRRHYAREARRETADPGKKKRAREARLMRRAEKLSRALRASSDRRPVLIILEGPDGAGKSSTIRRVRVALEGAFEVREVHFGAPPAGERGSWLARYQRELPRAGEVAIWDRSYYGRTVYDPHYGMTDEKTTRRRYREINELESQLSRDYRVVKIFLDTRGKRLARTIGKREANAPEKLEDSDYASFRDRKQIRRRFLQAIEKTERAIPWRVVSMDDRNDGRREILDLLRSDLL
jgi:AMP-polyphosphate phosphotransferase